MGFDKEQLRAEAHVWAQRRSADGVDAADVTAALTHALEFIESLPGDDQAERAGRRPRPGAGAPSTEASLPPAPEALRRLVGQAGSRPRRIQPGIQWSRDRWKEAFPEHGDLLDSLPELLDRDAVRRVAKDSHLNPGHAVTAFVVATPCPQGVDLLGAPRVETSMMTLSAVRPASIGTYDP